MDHRLLIGLLLLWAGCTAVRAAETAKFERVEEQAVLENLTKSKQFMAVATTRPAAEQRLILCSIVRIAVPAEDKQPERKLIETLHYRYDDGRTIRSTMDDASRDVVKVEALEAYPTPLAPEEIKAAQSLARDKVPAAKALLEAGDGKVKVQYLAPVISDRKHPQFGHRLAVLVIQTKGEKPKLTTIEVDLTSQAARPI